MSGQENHNYGPLCGGDEFPGQVPGPRHGAGPVSKFKNIACTSLTDQINGLLIVVDSQDAKVLPPQGTQTYDNCVKLDGEYTAQVNGLIVGVNGGCPERTPSWPGMAAAWTGCKTVERMPTGVVEGNYVRSPMKLDVNDNHTIQINGGLVMGVKNGRIPVPQVRPC
ncbi:unnamed protein product [Clonostachys rosea]|uniref:Uncharacterized protein n=1 Tax=Bionectria ochroleuca TaxID=29856 RepID=A0ABY6V015_BIOOC|nr:unnamed protein product [Clonostachys rosea]